MHISSVIHQKSYEKIVHMLRRHPITFVPRVLFFVVLLAVPIAVYVMIETLFPTLFTSDILMAVVFLLGSVYYLATIVFFYTQFTIFYLDLWIVTNDRIVDIEQHGLFSRTVSELDLYQIQDVTTQVHGFFPTLLHYGNVEVKTASSNTGIVFHDVKNPDALRQEILDLANKDRFYHQPKGEVKNV